MLRSTVFLLCGLLLCFVFFLFDKETKLDNVIPVNTVECEDYSTQSLRHVTGSHMFNSGVPLHAISAFLGHKDISSTEIYTKICPAEIHDIIQKMGVS